MSKVSQLVENRRLSGINPQIEFRKIYNLRFDAEDFIQDMRNYFATHRNKWLFPYETEDVLWAITSLENKMEDIYTDFLVYYYNKMERIYGKMPESKYELSDESLDPNDPDEYEQCMYKSQYIHVNFIAKEDKKSFFDIIEFASNSFSAQYKPEDLSESDDDEAFATDRSLTVRDVRQFFNFMVQEIRNTM